MKVTNQGTGTNVFEVAEGIFRINTPVDIAGGFSFNQYLISTLSKRRTWRSENSAQIEDTA